jgi:hypothetical protein
MTSFMIACIAFVYSDLCTEPNMLFNGLFNRLDVLFKTDKRATEGKPVHPLFMVLMYCSKCVSGQIAFWLFLYENWELYTVDVVETLFLHFGFTAVTILMTAFIKEIYKHLKHHD